MSNHKRPLEKPTSISNINPYQPNLIIKAKISAKTSLEELNTKGKESSMFSCQLLDNSGEIRMTFFAEQAKKFHEIIQIGRIYEIRYVKVKTAMKKYNDLNHVYELNAVLNTTINLDDTIPSKSIKLDLNFQNLKSISEVTEECCKDVIAIVKNIEDETEICSHLKNMTYKKRDLQIIDDSDTMINLTLWGDHSSNFKSSVGDIIVLKRAQVTVYENIVKLSSTNSTIILNDYEGKEKKSLEELSSSIK